MQYEVLEEGVIEGEMEPIMKQEPSPTQQEEESVQQEKEPMKEAMKVPVNDPRKIEVLEETINATNRSFEAFSAKIDHTLEAIMKQISSVEVSPPEVVQGLSTLKVDTGKDAKASKDADETPDEGDDDDEDQDDGVNDLDTSVVSLKELSCVGRYK